MAIHLRASPDALLTPVVANRAFIGSLVRREVAGRYRGSTLGLFWAVLNSVLMLVVSTFVFSEVFQSRWQGGTGSKSELARVLFAGLPVFNFFSECVDRVPTVFLGNGNGVRTTSSRFPATPAARRRGGWESGGSCPDSVPR